MCFDWPASKAIVVFSQSKSANILLIFSLKTDQS